MRIIDNMFVVDDQHRYPCEVVEVRDGEVFRLRRCRLGFESGSWLSIIYGTGTYSDNYGMFPYDRPFTEDPHTVEVWPSWQNFDEDDPLGYQNRDDVLALIAKANNTPHQPEETP